MVCLPLAWRDTQDGEFMCDQCAEESGPWGWVEYCRCGRPTPDLKLIETWGPPTAGAFPEEGTKGSQLKENSSVFPKGKGCFRSIKKTMTSFQQFKILREFLFKMRLDLNY